MSDEKEKGEEISVGPLLCDGSHAPYVVRVDGEMVEAGIGKLGLDGRDLGRAISFGSPDERGWRPVKDKFTITSPGSVARSGVATAAYRDGWDRVFSGRTAAGKAN